MAAAAERFALAGQTIDHGAPVSFLVSSSHGLGMTEGWAEIGDGKTRLRIEVDRATAPLLGLLTHRPPVAGGESLFCQLQLSALELDDTSKPGAYRPGPRRFRFSSRSACAADAWSASTIAKTSDDEASAPRPRPPLLMSHQNSSLRLGAGAAFLRSPDDDRRRTAAL